MRRDHSVLIFLLVVVMVFGLAMGMNQAWAEGDEGAEEEEELLQPRPNPMERPGDVSAPVMMLNKGDKSWDPFDKTGASGRTMKPGEEVMDDGQHGDGFILKDGRRGIMQRGAAGKMQFYLLQGGGKVLAPDGVYQLSGGSSINVSGGQSSMPIDPIDPIDPVESGGVVQSPGQMQMPGKMR